MVPLRATSTTSKRLERPEAGEHEGLGSGELDDQAVRGVVHYGAVVELHDIEQLGVPVSRGADLDQGQLPGHGVETRKGDRGTHANHLLKLLHGPLGRALVGVHHDGQPRDPRGGRGADGQAAHGEIAPPDETDGTVESDQPVLQQDRDRLGLAHAETSGVASPSIGSDSDPPGGIIGNTLASCSITNSTRAGPGSATAAATPNPAAPSTRPGAPRSRTPRPA